MNCGIDIEKFKHLVITFLVFSVRNSGPKILRLIHGLNMVQLGRILKETLIGLCAAVLQDTSDYSHCKKVRFWPQTFKPSYSHNHLNIDPLFTNTIGHLDALLSKLHVKNYHQST
jgi:hypothetical protein